MTGLKNNLIALGLLAVLLVIGGIVNRPKPSGESSLATPGATLAPETTPPAVSRVVPFKDIGKLVNKSRSGWIKTLGKPTSTFPPPTWAKNISGTESWRTGDEALSQGVQAGLAGRTLSSQR